MERFLWMLLECTLTMSALAGLMLAISPLWTRRYSARSAYVAWLILLAGFLVVYRPHFTPAPVRVSVPRVAQQRVVTMPRADAPEEAETAAIAAHTPTAPTVPMPATKQRANIPALLFAAWALGAAALLTLRLSRHARFMRSVRRWSRPVTDAGMLAALSAERAATGVRRPVALKVCRAIDSPMLVGLVRPAVLLPDVPLDAQALSLVLRHELVHLRRGDLWGRLLMLAAACVHWFNPLMNACLRAATRQCEAACDAAVMRGMPIETRRRYGETILALLRGRGTPGTALSTQYSADKRSVKGRILSILDMRPKRLGTLVVAAVLATALGLGAAFALATELRSPLTTVDRAASLPEWELPTYPDRDMDRHVAASRKLDALLAKHEVEGEYCIANTIGWDAIESDLDAASSREDVLALIDAHSVIIEKPDDRAALDAQIDAILLNAGYPALPGRSYSLSAPVSGYEHSPFWSVLTYGTDTDPYVSLLLDTRLRVLRLSPQHSASFTDTRPLTDAERAMARETALGFARAHASAINETLDITYVSDVAFAANAPEPYALVWLFGYHHGPDGGNLPTYNEDHTLNQGIEVAIGLESGQVLSLVAGSQETNFVNNAQAEHDWVAATGLEYPIYDVQYLLDYVSPSISALLHQLLDSYGDSLTGQDKLIALHLAESNTYALTPGCGWEALEAALCACDSAEAFAALLNADYPGITQAMPGETTREQLAPLAETTIDAIGWGDQPSRSWLFCSEHYYPASVQVYAADVQHTDVARIPGVFITMNLDGSLQNVGGDSPLTGIEGERFDTLPDDQRAALAERAMAMASLCGEIGIESPADVVFAEYTHDGNIEANMINAWVYTYTEAFTNPDGAEKSFPMGIALSLGIDDGRVYQLSVASEEMFEASARDYPTET